MGETLGGRIRHLRELKGWTQQQLAAAVGVSRETVGNWETGVSTPRNREALLWEALGAVGPSEESVDRVLLNLPEGTLAGMSEIEREEVAAVARESALRRAREIRGR